MKIAKIFLAFLLCSVIGTAKADESIVAAWCLVVVASWNILYQATAYRHNAASNPTSRKENVFGATLGCAVGAAAYYKLFFASDVRRKRAIEKEMTALRAQEQDSYKVLQAPMPVNDIVNLVTEYSGISENTKSRIAECMLEHSSICDRINSNKKIAKNSMPAFLPIVLPSAAAAGIYFCKMMSRIK